MVSARSIWSQAAPKFSPTGPRSVPRRCSIPSARRPGRLRRTSSRRWSADAPGGGDSFGVGAFGGAFVPPGVIYGGDDVAQVGADGACVAADELLDGFPPGRRWRGDAA